MKNKNRNKRRRYSSPARVSVIFRMFHPVNKTRQPDYKKIRQHKKKKLGKSLCWNDKVFHTELLDRSSLHSVECNLLSKKLHCKALTWIPTQYIHALKIIWHSIKNIQFFQRSSPKVLLSFCKKLWWTQLDITK